MYDGAVNKKSGILVIQLPGYGTCVSAPHGNNEKLSVYPNFDWVYVDTRTEYEERHPYLPARIIDNLEQGDSNISVTTWDTVVSNPESLRTLIDLTFDGKQTANYDLARQMLRRNL